MKKARDELFAKEGLMHTAATTGTFTKVPASLIIECIAKLQKACEDSCKEARIISTGDAYVHVWDCPDAISYFLSASSGMNS